MYGFKVLYLYLHIPTCMYIHWYTYDLFCKYRHTYIHIYVFLDTNIYTVTFYGTGVTGQPKSKVMDFHVVVDALKCRYRNWLNWKKNPQKTTGESRIVTHGRPLRSFGKIRKHLGILLGLFGGTSISPISWKGPQKFDLKIRVESTNRLKHTERNTPIRVENGPQAVL